MNELVPRTSVLLSKPDYIKVFFNTCTFILIDIHLCMVTWWTWCQYFDFPWIYQLLYWPALCHCFCFMFNTSTAFLWQFLCSGTLLFLARNGLQERTIRFWEVTSHWGKKSLQPARETALKSTNIDQFNFWAPKTNPRYSNQSFFCCKVPNSRQWIKCGWKECWEVRSFNFNCHFDGQC